MTYVKFHATSISLSILYKYLLAVTATTILIYLLRVILLWNLRVYWLFSIGLVTQQIIFTFLHENTTLVANVGRRKNCSYSCTLAYFCILSVVFRVVWTDTDIVGPLRKCRTAQIIYCFTFFLTTFGNGSIFYY